MDQWEWELRVIDQQAGAAEDKTPVCVGGRGATPPQYSGGPTGYRLMLKRQEMGEKMFPPTETETVISMLTAAHPDGPASSWDLLRDVIAKSGVSLDRRLEESGPPCMSSQVIHPNTEAAILARLCKHAIAAAAR